MNDADLQERMQLAIERISEIKEEDQTIWDTLAKMDAGAKNLKTYFDSVAEFILYVYDVYEIVSQPGKIDLPLSKLQFICRHFAGALWRKLCKPGLCRGKTW